jgi:polysaccharide export outer membrane protein
MRRIATLAAAMAALLQPLGAAAQDGGYVLKPGDTLNIEVLEDPGLNRTVLVTPDGSINVPLAGVIRAQGRSVQAVESDLAARLAPNFATTPTVFVGVQSVFRAPDPAPTAPAAPPTIDVFVIGEVGSTGRLQLDPGTTLLQAFAQMGGFTPFAATKRLQLRRPDPTTGRETVYEINYDAIENGASPNGQVTLQDGDVIVVPQRRLFE